MEKKRTVFFLSDRTGITAETLGHSLLTQFDGAEFRQVTLPFIDHPDRAREAVERINRTARETGEKPLLFSTLINDDVRDIVNHEAEGLLLDFFDAFIGPLERELDMKSTHTAGRAHGVADRATYTARIDAVNYALANDDGVTTRNFNKADLILVGVSRSGKTPTCLYMALQYGVNAANYPLTEEELEKGRLPDKLLEHKSKLYGLTIEPRRLQEIRRERRPDSRYASPHQIRFEVGEAESMFRKARIPHINTTSASIEEIATTILHETGIKRRFY